MVAVLGRIAALLAIGSSLTASRGQVDGRPTPSSTTARFAESRGGDTLFHELVIEGPTNGPAGGPNGTICRTHREVSVLRTLQIPAAAIASEDNPNTPSPSRHTTILLWNELHPAIPGEEHGRVRPYVAFRLGGVAGADGTWHDGDANQDGVFDAGFVCLDETDYRLRFIYQNFNPVPVAAPDGGDPDPRFEPWPTTMPVVASGLAASSIPAYDRNGDGTIDTDGFNGGGCHLYIVQFVTQPLEEYRTAIRSHGGIVREFVESNAYVVEMTEDARARVAQEPFVRWTGPLDPVYRISPLLVPLCFDAEGNPRGIPRAKYDISALERGDTQRSEIAALIERIGGEPEPFDGGGYSLRAALTPAQIQAVLRSDRTLWLNKWEEPQTGGVTMPAPMVCGTPPIAYELSGIDCLSAAPYNFRGQGVRGATWGESKFRLNAPDYNRFGPGLNGPPIVQAIGAEDGGPHFAGSHGTSVFGLLFGKDVVTGSNLYSGVLSDADQGYFASSLILMQNPRITFSEEQACSLDVVVQSSSAGTIPSTVYDNSARD